MARNEVEVVEYEPAYAEVLADFVAKVWDPQATAAALQRSREANAASDPSCLDGRIPTILFLLNGAVVGYITTLPERIHVGGRVEPAYWMSGFHVLPEHRNGPVGVMVARELLRVAPSTLTLVVEPAPVRIFCALGYRNLGRVPNYLKLVRGAEVARRIDPDLLRRQGLGAWQVEALRMARGTRLDEVAAHLLGLATRVWTGVATPLGRRPQTSVLSGSWRAGEEYDRLWRALSGRTGMGAVRDAGRLEWRFARQRDRYVLVEARQGGALAGYCVVARPKADPDPRLAGIRIAPVSDLLFPPDELGIGCALLAAAERFVVEQGIADALIASTPHRLARRALARSGYLRIPGNLNLVVHPSLLGRSDSVRLEDWWLARGDNGVDESF